MAAGLFHHKWVAVDQQVFQDVLLNAVLLIAALVDLRDSSDSAVVLHVAVKLAALKDAVDVVTLVNAVLGKYGQTAVILAERMDAAAIAIAVVLKMLLVLETVALNVEWAVQIVALVAAQTSLETVAIGIYLSFLDFDHLIILLLLLNSTMKILFLNNQRKLIN